jgi:crotonobetainyl-CoA:carnitine CoA-transferase CaiB-like acyl-CoA transferase
MSLLAEFGLEDVAVGDPDEPPETEDEARRRERLGEAVAARLGERPGDLWVERLHARGIPCEKVRTLDRLFDDAQLEANGLVQRIWQPGMDAVSLLGNLFKLDGQTHLSSRPAPARGEHTDEILSALPSGRPERGVTG